MSLCVYVFYIDNFNLLAYKSSQSLPFILHYSCTQPNHSSIPCQKQFIMVWGRSYFLLYVVILLSNHKLDCLFIYSSHGGLTAFQGTLQVDVKHKWSCSPRGVVFPMHSTAGIKGTWVHFSLFWQMMCTDAVSCWLEGALLLKENLSSTSANRVSISLQKFF